MFMKIVLCFLFAILLSACSSDEMGSGQQQAYQTPQLPNYMDDNTGEDNFPLQRHADGHKQFVFDPKVPAWAVYDEDGQRLKTGRASGGRDYCPDINRGCKTITGTYRIYEKKGSDCYSKIFPVGEGGAPMPYCMYFHGGYAIHGSYFVPNYNASHGCIRVLPSAAEWLNEEVLGIGTKVEILSY